MHIDIYSTAITLFLVLNPLGNIPAIVSTLQTVDSKRRTKVMFRECIFALLILLLFLFAGHAMLKGLKVSESSLSIAGGMILFLIAIRLIFPPIRQEKDKSIAGEPFLVPIAVPMIAGPATMATLIMISSQHPGCEWEVLLALLCAWLVVTVIVMSSMPLSRLLGIRVLTALERLMGMLLTTVAVQMFLSGIERFYHL